MPVSPRTALPADLLRFDPGLMEDKCADLTLSEAFAVWRRRRTTWVEQHGLDPADIELGTAREAARWFGRRRR